MSELIDGRTPHSKVFDLGNRQFRREISLGSPMHYDDGAGSLIDIDLSARMDRGQFLIDKAPYALRVDPNVPAYRYTSPTRGEVTAELIEIGGQAVVARPAVQDGDAFVWAGMATDTDYRIIPRRFGVTTLVVLHSPDAAKEWKYRLAGDTGLIKPIVGRDAKAQVCEIEQSVDGDVLTARWTGRATTQMKLRRDPANAWKAEPVYPVYIDPTVNEVIGTGADDCASAISFNNSGTVLAAGIVVGAIPLWVGTRFQTVGVPAGATIDSATLSVEVLSMVGSPSTRVYADDVDDAAAFSGSNLIKNITKTTAFAAFAPPSAGVKNITVTTLVAELVARGGWASNNDMRFGFFDVVGSGTNYVSMAALEHASAQEARLSIDYTAASTGQPYIMRTGGVPGMSPIGGGVW